MSFLEKLKSTTTRAELAHILGFQPDKLSYILYKLPDSEKYHTFEIPKKNGSTRIIQAPAPPLKTLQSRLADVLYVCSEEINKKEYRRPLSHGFKKGYSIHSNAKCHKNRRYVLNFDLENFFPSINFGRVRGYFIKNRDFELKEQVATTIAKIACHNNELPQGSPCSPVVSNLIAHLLDIRLVRIAMKYNRIHFLQYTGNIKDVLQLSGGTDQLASFVGIYKKKVKRYKAWNPSQPVILLTDNDKGAKSVFNAVRDHSKDKSTVNISSTNDFFYVNNNLYLVKIPSIKEKTIEDLFDPKWLNYEINGKKFNRTNKSDDTSYGKSIFAKRVIAKNFAKVGFSEFIPLLDRFVRVIDDFSKKRSNSQSIT